MGISAFRLYRLLVSLSMKARPAMPKPSRNIDETYLDDEYVFMEPADDSEIPARSVRGRSSRGKSAFAS